MPSARQWRGDNQVKVVGHDTEANDHPRTTAIGPQRNGPLLPHLEKEYFDWSGGRDWAKDFPDRDPVHQTRSRPGYWAAKTSAAICILSPASAAPLRFFPWNWDRGDGCIIRLVAITDPGQAYRIERGDRF